MNFATFVAAIYVVLKMVKVYAHRTSWLEANIIGCATCDLKTTKLCHQDVGQMDMYVRMYDEMMLPQGHNPTIGLILCADTDDDVAHYSVLNGSDQLFAAKYLTYMPSRADLRREIEQQKEFFLLQHKGDNKD